MKHAITLLLALMLAAPVYATKWVGSPHNHEHRIRAHGSQIATLQKNNREQWKAITRLRLQVDNLIRRATAVETLHAFDAAGLYMGPVVDIFRNSWWEETATIWIQLYGAPIWVVTDSYLDGGGENENDLAWEGLFPTLYFKTLGCTGIPYAFEDLTLTGEESRRYPRLFSHLYVFDGRAWTQDGRDITSEGIVASIDNGVRGLPGDNHESSEGYCETDSSGGFPTTSELVDIGPWPYQFPITIELF